MKEESLVAVTWRDIIRALVTFTVLLTIGLVGLHLYN